MSDLVGNPEDRFSRVAAQLIQRVLFQHFVWMKRSGEIFVYGLYCMITSTT